MGDWLKKFKRKTPEAEVLKVPPPPNPPSIISGGAGGVGGITTSVNTLSSYPYGYNLGGTATAAIPPSSYSSVSIPSAFSMGGSIHVTPPHIITLNNSGKEIVKVNCDGSVKWADGYQIDEAAEAFSRMLSLSTEICAGITKKVKLDMRDSVFNDLISIAKEKGSLTAEDLTYLLEASKIVEKLRGGKNDV